MRKLIIIIFTTLALTLNVNAGTDGELILKKNEPSEVKDRFEELQNIINISSVGNYGARGVKNTRPL